MKVSSSSHSSSFPLTSLSESLCSLKWERMIWWISCCCLSYLISCLRLLISVWRSWILVGLTDVFSNLLVILLTSNLLLVINSFGLGLFFKDFLSLFKKTFFSWGSGMEFIVSNKKIPLFCQRVNFLGIFFFRGWGKVWFSKSALMQNFAVK